MLLSSCVPAKSACKDPNGAMAFGIMAWCTALDPVSCVSAQTAYVNPIGATGSGQSHSRSNTVVQVLFCKLCKDQRDLYRAYLNSQEVDAIFAGNRQALAGIDILRKICNHPDLLERTKWEGSEEYGRPEKSGKLTVLMKVTCACTCATAVCHLFKHSYRAHHIMHKCHCCLLSLQTQLQGAPHHAPVGC